MKTRKRIAAVLAVVLVAGGLGAIAPIASATAAQPYESIPDQYCSADTTVIVHAAYDDPDVIIKAAYDDPDVVTPAIPGEFVNYNWNGGNTDTAPAFPGEGWKSNSGNHNGHPDPVDGLTYDQGKNDGGNASWFHWALEGYHAEVITPGAHHDAVYGPGAHHDAVTRTVPGTCNFWVTWEAPEYAPNATDAASVGWPQQFVGYGEIPATECNTTRQHDRYEGTRAELLAFLQDGVLSGPASSPEDAGYAKQWYFTHGKICATAQFDVTPTGATCEADGTLDTGIFPIVREGYTLTVDREYDGPGAYTITATANPGYALQGDVSKVITVDGKQSYEAGDDCTPPPAGEPVQCESDATYATSTNLDPQGWSVKPNRPSIEYVDGGLKLDASDGTGSAWAILTLPAGTHLSEIGDLTTTFVGEHGIYWGGIILEGGDLTDQLHYDDNGRFWTQQSGIFTVDRAGYYQSWNIVDGADQPGTWTGISDPVIGTLKIYVNNGENVTVATQSYLCGTQGFDYERAIPEAPLPVVGEDVSAVSECVEPLDGTATMVTTTTPYVINPVWNAETWTWDAGTVKEYGTPVVTSSTVTDEGCEPGTTPTPTPTPTPSEEPTTTPEPTPSETPTTEPTPSETPFPSNPIPPKDETLSHTGMDAATLGGIAALLAVLGGLGLVASRKRR